VVGDKCLYDVGLSGATVPGASTPAGPRRPLLRLARRSRAPRRRSPPEGFFRQNRLGPLPIEEEIAPAPVARSASPSNSTSAEPPHFESGRRTGRGRGGRRSRTAAADRPSGGAGRSADRGSGRGKARGGGESRPAPAPRGPPVRGRATGGRRGPGGERLPGGTFSPSTRGWSSSRTLDVSVLPLRPGFGSWSTSGGRWPALCDELSLYATGTQTLSRPPPSSCRADWCREEPPRRVLRAGAGIALGGSMCRPCSSKGPSTRTLGHQRLKGATGVHPERRGGDPDGVLRPASGAPLSILLVDEVEKATPTEEVLLGLNGPGGTTMDNRGETLWFVNTLFFYTSNKSALTPRLQASTAPIGLRRRRRPRGVQVPRGLADLKRTHSPEFVNRISVSGSGRSPRLVERILDLKWRRSPRATASPGDHPGDHPARPARR